MCGIAGIWFSAPREETELTGIGQRFSAALAHRGPDADGFYVDRSRSLLLMHRRLAILDLTPAGSQPMRSQCGRYTIIYNGECYNFDALRKRLVDTGIQFAGTSDTEVIVEACARWGFDRTLLELNGMFAFALWDEVEKTLSLARDRVGIKPLYFGWLPDGFIFGSELKALRVCGHFPAEVDPHSLGLFFKFGYIPAPHSIYRNVFKLPAGHSLVVRDPLTRPATRQYWSAFDGGGKDAGSAVLDREQAVDQLDALLRQAVRGQMISDVPLGAFLSGGIDSSTVVAMMQSESRQPVKTFTIGFEEGEFNESDRARAIAAHLGTEHSEMKVTAGEALGLIPGLPEMFDEPLADASQIPTYFVSRLARRQVTVSLSGDGGDELFMGYSHCLEAISRLKKLQRIPRRLRNCGGRLLARVPALLSFKASKYAAVLQQPTADGMYETMASHWFRPEEIVCGFKGRNERIDGAPDSSPVMAVTRWDFENYLPEDVLTKVDRASMAVSLEARVPILDHEVVSFALALPESLKVFNGQQKWILRQVLYRYVPAALLEGPKKGFSVPVGEWIRGPLREWAEELLSVDRLVSTGLLHPGPIRKKWKEHLERSHDWHELLWSVLVFQAWAGHWGKPGNSPA